MNWVRNIFKGREAKPRVVVICGPTATGKSDRAVELALKLNGEVVSADSRQVYKGMDLGSGKITEEEMQGITHHLLDVADPIDSKDFDDSTQHTTNMYSVADFQKDALQVIKEIHERGKVAIVCGGTGFFIDSLLYNIQFPSVAPNEALRAKLEQLPLEQLQKQLSESDPERFSTIDIHNKVRLIRALEIVDALGSVPPQARELRTDWNIEIEYIDRDDEVLKERIIRRIHARLEQGMIEEVEELNRSGVSFPRLEQFGLEYKYIALYLQGKITHEEMIKQLNLAIWHYAKRQRTWFKKYLPFITNTLFK